jgi:hypothetical protein
MSATTHHKPTVGLPPEQLQQWLAWVREDLHQLGVSIEYMLSEQARLAEQERLLGQLIQTLPALPSTPETATAVPNGAAAVDDASHAEQPEPAAGDALPRRDDESPSEESPLPAMPQFDVSWLIDPPS